RYAADLAILGVDEPYLVVAPERDPTTVWRPDTTGVIAAQRQLAGVESIDGDDRRGSRCALRSDGDDHDVGHGGCRGRRTGHPAEHQTRPVRRPRRTHLVSFVGAGDLQRTGALAGSDQVDVAGARSIGVERDP